MCKKAKTTFSFSSIDQDGILKQVLLVESAKVCQLSDIPTKITKENTDIFTNSLFSQIPFGHASRI